MEIRMHEEDVEVLEAQPDPNFSRLAKRRRILPSRWILDYWWKEDTTETSGRKLHCNSGIHCQACYESITGFANELDATAVPEWKDRYIDYVGAKKLLLKVERAYKSAPREGTPVKTPLGGQKDSNTHSPLFSKPGLKKYGSLLTSPLRPRQEQTREPHAPLLELPAPALSPESPNIIPLPEKRPATPHTIRVLHIRSPTPPPPAVLLTSKSSPGVRIRRLYPTPGGSPGITHGPITLRRRISYAEPARPAVRREDDSAIRALAELNAKKAYFFRFLDKELEKIDSFYRTQEYEATERLEKLREQLRIMRSSHPQAALPSDSYRHISQSRSDFDSRQPRGEVSVFTAKRKLKVAFVEYYHGLDLLKSYTALNRIAFRKINKKFDQTVNANPPMEYVNEKVENASFVASNVVDEHSRLVENLYSKHFEGGNRKAALGMLRKKALAPVDFTASLLRAGLFLGLGIALIAFGVVNASVILIDGDPQQNKTKQLQARYLLQIYGGYSLMLLLFVLFCIGAHTWSAARVNYQFIFQYDRRHVLDWQQLLEIPAAFSVLLGICMTLNFSWSGNSMFLYWPVVLIVLSAVLLFFPAPYFYWASRRWLLIGIWRLFLSGFYNVEFRDFLLGDMLCSETYAIGNIEVFFCLYARHWTSLLGCDDSHVLGFLTTLPGIYRALQCLRRYFDTQNAFPHLLNCGKYIFTILQYMTLSLFRDDKSPHLLAMFIAAASMNSVYCLLWDVFNDWSLGNMKARHPGLRNNLAYKRIWWYYTAIGLDVILRFNWIFYPIFKDNAGHSSLTSFMVALSEVFRRGIWMVIRVENEHCANVDMNKALRDTELPYILPEPTNVEAAMSERPQALGRMGSSITTAHIQDYDRRRPQQQDVDESDEDAMSY